MNCQGLEERIVQNEPYPTHPSLFLFLCRYGGLTLHFNFKTRKGKKENPLLLKILYYIYKYVCMYVCMYTHMSWDVLWTFPLSVVTSFKPFDQK